VREGQAINNDLKVYQGEFNLQIEKNEKQLDEKIDLRSKEIKEMSE